MGGWAERTQSSNVTERALELEMVSSYEFRACTSCSCLPPNSRPKQNHFRITFKHKGRSSPRQTHMRVPLTSAAYTLTRFSSLTLLETDLAAVPKQLRMSRRRDLAGWMSASMHAFLQPQLSSSSRLHAAGTACHPQQRYRVMLHCIGHSSRKRGSKGTAREKGLEKEDGKLRELQPPAMDNDQLE